MPDNNASMARLQQINQDYRQNHLRGEVDPTVSNQQLNEKAKDLNDSDSDLRKFMRSQGIYEPRDMKYNTAFYRIPRLDPYYMVEGGREYLFFTKPDLNIITTRKDSQNGGAAGELTTNVFNDTNIYGLQVRGGIQGGTSGSSYFVDLMDNGYKNTIADLNYSASTELGFDACPFIRILSNRKSSNMEIPDIVVNELETAQNMYGTRIFYPMSSMKSDEDIDFSIEFEDTQFLEVYQLFKAYDMYRQLKWLGLVTPRPEYIENKILCDHMSIYKFIVDVDGETILYYAKATGVYPKTISRSSFSEFQEKGQLKITVGFKLSGWFEDMEPTILADFNALVSNWIFPGDNNGSRIMTGAKEIPVWNDALGAVDGENIDYFYILHSTPEEARNSKSVINQGYGRYYLVAGKRP